MTYKHIVETGVIVPDVAAIKAEVESEWLDIAGNNATINPSSFEGRQIDAKVNERVSVARNNAELANQLNPNLSNGTFVDDHLALIGGKRDSAEQSTVELSLTGIANTVVSANSFVEDNNRNLWFLVAEVELDSLGLATSSFRSSDYGPVTAIAGSITKIISGVVGWETVTNPAAAVAGKAKQSEASAKRQRRNELGQNSRGIAESVIAAVYALDGVQGVQFRENNTLGTTVIDGVTLIGKSSWLCVDGGVTGEIVPAYYENRWGTDFNGAVSVQYTDPISNQLVTVKLDRPTLKPLKCSIEATVGQSQNAEADIKKAVIAYANGEVAGEDGFQLGLDSSPFEVASGVNVQLPEISVKKCQLAKVSDPLSTDTVINKVYEKATIQESDITVLLV
jgi:hypothetical protein